MSKDTLIKIDGETFRCSCGCNVFRRVPRVPIVPDLIYKCNGCGTVYSGEKPARKEAEE